jgi:nucleotide-binding universal stress UspA family protein
VTNIRTIAVGFDGSPDSEAALAWALDLAAPLGARVVAVHARGLLSRLEGWSSSTLESTVTRLAQEHGVAAGDVSVCVEEGDACSVLARCSHPPVDADLLVVGSRGEGKHPGLLLGSTSLELAQRADVALVIVPSVREVAPA